MLPLERLQQFWRFRRFLRLDRSEQLNRVRLFWRSALVVSVVNLTKIIADPVQATYSIPAVPTVSAIRRAGGAGNPAGRLTSAAVLAIPAVPATQAEAL